MESDRKKRRRSQESDNEPRLSDPPSSSTQISDGAEEEEGDSSSGSAADDSSDKEDNLKPAPIAAVSHVEGESDEELLEFTAPSASRVSTKPRQDVSSSSRRGIKQSGPTSIPVSAPPPPALEFGSLNVSAALVSSLSAMSIRKPTPVQAACIPQLLKGAQARSLFR